MAPSKLLKIHNKLMYIIIIMLFDTAMACGLDTIYGSIPYRNAIEIDPYDCSFIYDINLSNLNSATMPITIKLDIGPDYRDKNISFNISKYIILGPHESQLVPIRIPLNVESLPQCEFREWLSNEKNMSIWRRAWHCIAIEPVMGNPITFCDSAMTSPGLVKLYWNYRNWNVSPRIGNGETSFIYELEFNSSSEEMLILQVEPFRNSNWIDCGSKNLYPPIQI